MFLGFGSHDDDPDFEPATGEDHESEPETKTEMVFMISITLLIFQILVM